MKPVPIIEGEIPRLFKSDHGGIEIWTGVYDGSQTDDEFKSDHGGIEIEKCITNMEHKIHHVQIRPWWD